MKSYQERTIRACKKIAYKYRHPEDEFFFAYNYCPLCKIYKVSFSHGNCKGCFMANEDHKGGCMDFKTNKDARASNTLRRMLGKKPSEEFIARAEFFEQMAEELKEFPAEQFTKRFWKPFNIDLNR